MRLDLAEEWRCRRWRRLLNIIEHLPRHSQYVEALTQDDVVAEQMLDNPPKDDPEGKPVRRMSEWTADVELLTVIVNRLAELTQAVAALGGAKPRKIKPAPIPETAMPRVRRRRRDETHKFLVAAMLPKSDDES